MGEADEPVFLDAENYSGEKKERISYNQIVLEQIKKCCNTLSKEQRGGYTEKKPVQSAGITIVTNTYIPDTREEFCNSVRALKALVTTIKYDKKINEVIKEITLKFKELDIFIRQSKIDPKSNPMEVNEQYALGKFELMLSTFEELLEWLERIGYFKKEEYEA